MRKCSTLLIALVLFQGCYVLFGGGDAPPAPLPAPVDPDIPSPVPDRWGFSHSIPIAMQGKREHSLKLSAVMDAFADQIKYDGEQPEPRMVSTTDIAILFDRIVEYGFKGEGAYTQEFSNIVKASLRLFEPNDEAVDLTDKERRNVVQLFNALSQSLREVQ